MAGQIPKSWTASVVGEGDELYLELPDELLFEMNWKIGDKMIWEEIEEGCWCLRKHENLLTRVLKFFKMYK